MVDFCSYLRVSTGKQGVTGLGMDAQREAVARYVGARGKLLAEYVEVAAAGVPHLGGGACTWLRVGVQVKWALADVPGRRPTLENGAPSAPRPPPASRPGTGCRHRAARRAQRCSLAPVDAGEIP